MTCIDLYVTVSDGLNLDAPTKKTKDATELEMQYLEGTVDALKSIEAHLIARAQQDE